MGDFERDVVSSLILEARNMSAAVAEFRIELNSIKNSVADLSRVVKDGDGQGTLVTKVILLEKSAFELQAKVAAISATISRIDTEERQRRLLNSSEKLKLYGTILAAIIALIGTIVAIVLK